MKREKTRENRKEKKRRETKSRRSLTAPKQPKAAAPWSGVSTEE